MLALTLLCTSIGLFVLFFYVLLSALSQFCFRAHQPPPSPPAPPCYRAAVVAESASGILARFRLSAFSPMVSGTRDPSDFHSPSSICGPSFSCSTPSYIPIVVPKKVPASLLPPSTLSLLK